jgi:predicted nuclease of predicted toxin-antitoxin system
LADERIVVSKDDDFLILASRPGDRGRLIWVRLGKAIMHREPLQTIREKSIEAGTIEFRQVALLKVAQGSTTVEEVFRIVPTEYLAVEE